MRVAIWLAMIFIARQVETIKPLSDDETKVIVGFMLCSLIVCIVQDIKEMFKK